MWKGKKAVVVFGSSKVSKGSVSYESAYRLASYFAKDGISVITGGGPGIMEAANGGASDHGGLTGAFRCHIEGEPSNAVVEGKDTFVSCVDLHERKRSFLTCGDAFIVFPGGYGTLDELFEVLIHMQLRKIKPVPIVLYDTSYWEGLYGWMKGVLIENGMANVGDDFVVLRDDVDSVYKYVFSFWERE